MPKLILTTQAGNSNTAPLGEASQIPRDRRVLRQAFPASSVFNGVAVLPNRWAQTPFRVAMNAGDLLLRQAEPTRSKAGSAISAKFCLLTLRAGGTGRAATSILFMIRPTILDTKN